MSERFPCKTSGCSGTILPSTAQRTGGYCMRCVNREAHEERQRYIAQNRVDVDRFAGVSDPVEVLRLMHERPPHDELKKYLPYARPKSEVYKTLNGSERQRVLDLAEASVASGSDAREMVACLACFTSADLTGVQGALLRRGDPDPCEAFRGAGAQVVESLVELANGSGTTRVARSNALCALAWTRHPQAIAKLREWRDAPPSWQQQLYVPVHRYSQAAGWCFDAQGRVRNLYKETCHALVPASKAASSAAVTVVQDSDSVCRLCRRPLTVLCSIDLSAPELRALGLDGARLSLPICEVCHCFDLDVFFELSPDGGFTWSDRSTTDSAGTDATADWSLLPREQLFLGPRRGPMETANSDASQGSQLGGLPGWVQDIGYPECAGCGEPMLFIAQLDTEDIDDSREGVYYGFLCETCRLSSATYQQT